MGVFLSIVDSSEEEIAGVDLGSHARAEGFLNYVAGYLESGQRGARFPNLFAHLDANKDWDGWECEELRCELETVVHEIEALPDGDRDSVSARSEVLSMADDLLRLAKQGAARGLPIHFR